MSRTKGSFSEKTRALMAAAFEILEETQPNSVRGVAYKLCELGLLPNMKKKETQKVSRMLTLARKRGIVPWDWVADDTREARRIPQYKNPEEFVEETQYLYRRGQWPTQKIYIEVWSEKGTVGGVLAPVLDYYGITFRVFHGFDSTTNVHEIATLAKQLDKPFIALYVGDIEPSGMYMSEVDLPNRFKEEEFSNIEMERVALVLDVDTKYLRSTPAEEKKTDPRYKWFTQNHGDWCWELDAMDPNDLRERVEEYIRMYLDMDEWARLKLIEQGERDSYIEVSNNWLTSLKKRSSG